MKAFHQSLRSASGFTLAEVVIAVGIISIGFLGSFAMVLQSGKQASAAEESSLVCTGLEQQMDLLRTLSWTALTTGTGITGTVWSAQPPAISGVPVTHETITITPYSQANTQTLTATWNVPSAPTVTLAPAVGGTTQALSTATAVQVVATMTWTGRRSGRKMTQSLVTVISEGGISASVLP
jgi:prepilin-type N-terminal cleavage/methylation domain-containing protein